MEIYMGEPPEGVKSWIISHKPAEPTRETTRIWWSDDEYDYDDYLIEGPMNYQALIKGLCRRDLELHWNRNGTDSP